MQTNTTLQQSLSAASDQVTQGESRYQPRYDDPYYQDYEENERQVELHRQRVERWYIDNEAPIDPAKWKRDRFAWELLKNVFLEMYACTRLFANLHLGAMTMRMSLEDPFTRPRMTLSWLA